MLPSDDELHDEGRPLSMAEFAALHAEWRALHAQAKLDPAELERRAAEYEARAWSAIEQERGVRRPSTEASRPRKHAIEPPAALPPLPALDAIDGIAEEHIPAALVHLAARLAATAQKPPRLDLQTEPFPPTPRVSQVVAADRTGLKLAQVRWLTRTARVPSVQVGKEKLVDVRDIEAALAYAAAHGLALRRLPRVTFRHDHHEEDDARPGPAHPRAARPHAGRVR
jgi:hypothetical protein